MFNSYAHYRDEFVPLQVLSEADKQIYKAREAQYRSRYVWSAELERVWVNCLVHMSPNVPGKVAYFSSVEMMRMNRTTRTSPQMFLQRFLSDAPTEIKVAWEVEVLNKTLPEVEFVSNTNPDGWKDVYERGPHSCMAGSDLVAFYAHPENNLALAYHQNDCGRIVYRTIVNKKTMAYARIYGEQSELFAASLKKLGYHRSGDDTLVGETIYVEFYSCCKCDELVTVGPFLDCESNLVKVTHAHEKPEGQIGADAPKGECLTYSADDDGDYCCSGCS